MTKTVLAVLAALSVTGCVVGSNDVPAENAYETATLKDLTAARNATATYHDIAAATADGYVNSGLPCIEGQGFHFVNGSLIGTNDVTRPHFLLYFPDATGTLELIALEWIKPIVDDTTTPSTLFGQTFHGPENVDGVPFSFFGLHVWAWKDNPDGLFDDTNPRIHCP